MRRFLAACLLVVSLVLVGASVAGAQATTTTTTSGASGADSTMPVEADPSATTTTVVTAPTELAHTGPRDTTATLGAGFLLLGLGMVSLGAARRMLSHERR